MIQIYLWRRTKVRMKVRTCTCTRVLPDGSIEYRSDITLYEGIFRTSVFRTEYVRSCVLRWGSTTTDRRALFISYTTCSCTCTCTVHVIHSTRDIHSTRVRVGLHVGLHHNVHVPELYNVYSCTHTRTCSRVLYSCTRMGLLTPVYNITVRVQIKRIKTHAFNKIV